jgi:transcriptional regulator with XRE-family HTH domain
MNTKSNDPQKIKEAFDQFFNSFTAEEKLESNARLIMFRFLDIIERRTEELGWNRKQLAEKVGTSPSYITQLFRGDKLVNMLTLAKFQNALGLEFEIAEKKSYEETVEAYAPVGDGKGFWVYRPLEIPNYNIHEDLPELEENQPAKVA